MRAALVRSTMVAVAAVIALLADPAQNAKIAAGGRQWAVERYNWRTVYRGWDRIYGATPTATAGNHA